jgi:two-component system aerobic respiration control sensor histidine kinase ArcB
MSLTRLESKMDQRFMSATAQKNLTLQNLVDSMPGIVSWKSEDLRYQGANKKFLHFFGFNHVKELLGKTDQELNISDQYKQCLTNKDIEVLKTQKSVLSLQHILPSPESSPIIFETEKRPLYDEKNQLQGILCLASLKSENYQDSTLGKTTLDIDYEHDQVLELISELSIAKEKAESQNKAKSMFIANMSHDLRTPLTGVVGISQLLEHKTRDPEEKQYARWINKSGEQLLGLLNNILNKVSSDKLAEEDTCLELFNLRLCIQDIIQLELPMTELKGLELKADIDENVPYYVVSDRNKLHRILLNLLGNAIKFTQHGSVTIKIQCLFHTKSSVVLQFCISDTGIGIPPKEQANIFDRFVRTTSSLNNNSSGHGVGLHIAQTYAKMLGAEIQLKSEEGKGSSFYFDLNLKLGKHMDETSPKNQNIDTSSTPIKQVSKSHIPHLLLIEDNDVALHMVESITAKAGFHFTSSHTGEKALELAKAISFDLIITDIGLPGISGYEFTNLLRAWEKENGKKPVPIVGLTAHAREHAEVMCLEAGLNDVYTKPIKLATVQEIVAHFVTSPIAHTEQNEISGEFEEPSPLGIDLPRSEALLFKLSAFPLLHTPSAVEQLGSADLLKEILTLMEKELPKEYMAIEKAYQDNDWKKIEKLAHRIKSSALYCGTIRLKYACQYLERYHKAGHTALLEGLYQQLTHVLEETQKFLVQWLRTP